MNTNRSNTVVILGTGATIGSGYTRCGQRLPGDRGFFGNPMVQKRLGDYPALDVMLNLFREVHGSDLASVGLEEVWTFLEFCSNGPYKDSYDLNNEKQEWLKRIRTSKRNDEHCRCGKFRAAGGIPPDLGSIDMSLLAGWDLRCLVSETYRGIESPGVLPNYQKLMDTYGIPQAEPTVFISLNYDTVLEQALAGFTSNPYPWFYPHIDTSEHRDSKGVQVLKPHGSLNWRQTGNIPAVSISTDYSLQPVSNVSTDDNIFEQVAITPPTQLKGALNIPETQAALTTDLFGKIWKSVADALVDADRVFIIGYSFPSTDHHFRTLLRLLNAKRKWKKYEEVYCCTRADAGQEGLVFANANRFFPADTENFHQHDRGFENFVSASEIEKGVSRP
ncbi:MAG TPA: SIR2 family protein [Patescibacteria group bacterium]|nr:SIR2 family protein [Patescibacteria group bacterium]